MSKGGSKFGVAVLVGAAIGYTASLFVSKKTREEHKKKLETTIDTLSDKFLKPEDKKRVQELFSSFTKTTSKEYLQLKKTFESNLQAASKTWSDIDKSRYYSLVENAVNELKTKKHLNQKQLVMLKDFFLADIETFKDNKKTQNKTK